MAHPNLVRPQIVHGNWLLSSLLCPALIPFREIFDKVAHHIRTPARKVLPWERRTWRSALDPSLGACGAGEWGLRVGFLGTGQFWGSVSVFVGFGIPETARSIVGNGDVKATGWGKSWWSHLRGESKTKCNAKDTRSMSETLDEKDRGAKTGPGKKAKFKMANPMTALRILFWKDTALVLWMAGSQYAVWYAVQASIPAIYKDIYHFNELQIGLCYLTGGFGTVSGGYLNGKLMDWNYRATARSIGHTIDKVSGDDLNDFPIERARARGSYYLLAIYIAALAGYGWSVQAHTHEAVPLILQCVLAALCTGFQQTFNALLVDIFPASPSTAAASGNITRCALSAVVVAVLQPLVDVMGRGWFFTTLTVLSGGGGLAAAWMVKNKGMKSRRQRISKTGKAKTEDSEE